jgi:hypothetical protein
VAIGVHRGADSVLASVRVWSSWDLGRLEPGFPAETSPQEWRALVIVFAGAATVMAAEVDINNILTRGADPSKTVSRELLRLM